MAQEKWYTPADIGMHIDENNIVQEKLRTKTVKGKFEHKLNLTDDFLSETEKERDKWLAANKQYNNKFKENRLFNLYKEHNISLRIKQFTKSQVRLFVIFKYGYSRWHHYYILLKDYIIQRDEQVDKIFELKEQEELYSFSFKGVEHGMNFPETINKLGNKFSEYAGQSPQYRNIYYKEYNIEIIIQDGTVKYLRKGKPGWMGSNLKYKDEP